MINIVDENHPTAKALRAAEQRLNEVVATLPNKQKALADVTQLWLAYSRERIARRLRHGDAGLAP